MIPLHSYLHRYFSASAFAVFSVRAWRLRLAAGALKGARRFNEARSNPT